MLKNEQIIQRISHTIAVLERFSWYPSEKGVSISQELLTEVGQCKGGLVEVLNKIKKEEKK